MCICADAVGDDSTWGTYGGPTSVGALGHGLEYDLLGGETKCHRGGCSQGLSTALHSSADWGKVTCVGP